MKQGPFLDSGAFIAFLDRSDALHDAVRALFADPPPRWSTSVHVVSETYGWFLHRMGEEAARTFRRLVASLPDLRLFAADLEHHAAVLLLLDRLRGQRLTYVDASSLVRMKQHHIPLVWGTDHHLGLEGAKVVPGGG